MTDCPYLLMTQGQWANRVPGPEPCESRVCTSSMYLISQSYMGRKWEGSTISPLTYHLGYLIGKVFSFKLIYNQNQWPPNNRVTLTYLYHKFHISSSDSTIASSGNQLVNEKQLAEAESGRNAVILVKTEKEKCFKKYVVPKHYLPLPLSLLMSAHRS